MPVRNHKALFGIAIKIYSVWILILNESALWLVNMESQNTQVHFQISPRRTCNPCGSTMRISSRYQRLLIFDVKRTTKIDGMGPFKRDPWTQSNQFAGFFTFLLY